MFCLQAAMTTMEDALEQSTNFYLVVAMSRRHSPTLLNNPLPFPRKKRKPRTWAVLRASRSARADPIDPHKLMTGQFTNAQIRIVYKTRGLVMNTGTKLVNLSHKTQQSENKDEETQTRVFA